MASSSQDSAILLRRLTYALYQRRDMERLEQLHAHLDSPAVQDALATLLETPGVSFDVAIKALNMLAPLTGPIAAAALLGAIEHPLIKVRRLAIELLCQREDPLPWATLSRLLISENAYQVRVALVTLLAHIGLGLAHVRGRRVIGVVLITATGRGEHTERAHEREDMMTHQRLL